MPRIVIAMGRKNAALMIHIEELIRAMRIPDLIVLCATNQAAALEAVASSPAADLAICDWSVQGFPRKIKRASPKTRVILTGCMAPPSAHGADEFVRTRPFDDSHMEAAVRRLLATSGP